MITLDERQWGDKGLVTINGAKLLSRPEKVEPGVQKKDYFIVVQTPRHKQLKVRINIDHKRSAADRDWGRDEWIERIQDIKGDRVDLVVNPVDISEAGKHTTTLYLRELRAAK